MKEAVSRECSMTAQVVQIPTQLDRMKKADNIVKQWLHIQDVQDQASRIQLYADLRSQLLNMKHLYSADLHHASRKC